MLFINISHLPRRLELIGFFPEVGEEARDLASGRQESQQVEGVVTRGAEASC